jgi:hypothetical protein
MNQPQSVGPTPVKGEPVDVHEERTRREKVEKAVREKVQKAMEEAGKIVRRHAGPPGTP